MGPIQGCRWSLWFYRGVAAVLLLTLSSCAPLGDVRDFASLSKQAVGALPALVTDYKRSLVSQRAHNLFVFTKVPLIEARRRAEIECPQDMVTPSKLSPCGNFQDLIDGMRVFEAYLDSVRKLAQDELGNYDKAIDTIGRRLETSFSIKKTEGAAISGIAKLLSKVFTSGLKQKGLSSSIVAADHNVAEITEGYEAVIDAYLITLGNEKAQLETILPRAFAAGPTVETSQDQYVRALGSFTVSELQGALDIRISGARAFKKGLQKIREGHFALASKARQAKIPEVRDIARQYVSEMIPVVKEIKTAFF